MELNQGKKERMFGRAAILLGFTLLWLLPLAQRIQASDAYEAASYSHGASEHRNARDAAELIERGRALVTDSPQFREGIRLTAWATEEDREFEPGLASAVYYFGVPSRTRDLKITIGYADVSKDDDTAGRLWIKTVDGDQGKAVEPEDDIVLYGDTFILRSDRVSEIIYVPSDRYVEDGTIEMHIVASGRDSLDVEYIRVEYLEKKPARIEIVHHSYDNYWYRWPPYWYGYHYVYWGPCYWPRTPLIYVHWVWPHRYYWHTYRPWYRFHLAKYRHRHPHWYRRYPYPHRAGPGHPHVRKRTPIRRSPTYGRVRIEKRRDDLLPHHRPSRTRIQKPRRSIRAKPQPVIPRHTPTKGKMGKKGREPTPIKNVMRPSQVQRPKETTKQHSQKQRQSRTVQRKSPSKSVAEEGSRARPRASGIRTRSKGQPNLNRGGRAKRMSVGKQMSRR